MSIENLPDYAFIQFMDVKCIGFENIIFYKTPYQNDFGDLDFDINLIKNTLPDDIKNSAMFSISWQKQNANDTGFNLAGANGGFYRFEPNQENYNKWIKPYVDIWQQVKNRKDQEQEEIEKEYNKFENRQKRALTQLNQNFEDVKERAYIKSSLGFTSDADSVANENITGLLLTIGDNTIQFCDYYNEFHTLNKSQLTTLQNEIIQNAQNLYTQKWQYRTAIENATDNSSLDEAVSQINFTYMSFKQE